MPNGQIANHVMWVDADDEHVLINTEVHRAKFKGMQADPNVTVMIWQLDDPYSYAEVRGVVTDTVRGPEARLHIDALSDSTAARRTPARSRAARDREDRRSARSGAKCERRARRRAAGRRRDGVRERLAHDEQGGRGARAVRRAPQDVRVVSATACPTRCSPTPKRRRARAAGDHRRRRGSGAPAWDALGEDDRAGAGCSGCVPPSPAGTTRCSRSCRCRLACRPRRSRSARPRPPMRRCSRWRCWRPPATPISPLRCASIARSGVSRRPRPTCRRMTPILPGHARHARRRSAWAVR